jgi:K+-sensing histidine kinase KdpD
LVTDIRYNGRKWNGGFSDKKDSRESASEEQEMLQEQIHTIPDSHDLDLPNCVMGVQKHHMPFAKQDTYEESVSALSHELRTTLAIITLLSGNLDLLYGRLSDGQRQKIIRDIRTHTQKLNDFIDGVLALCNSKGVIAM